MVYISGLSHLKLVIGNVGRVWKRTVRMFQGAQQLTCMKQVSKIGLLKLNELTKSRTRSSTFFLLITKSSAFMFLSEITGLRGRGCSFCWGTNRAKGRENFGKCWMWEVRERQQGWEMAAQAKRLLRRAGLVMRGEASEMARSSLQRTERTDQSPLQFRKL